MITFHDVTYSYPAATQPALDHVSLTIDEGEFILVCGPSGGGKSTLLRAINGLVPHFHGGRWSGQVIVAGQDTRTTPPRELAGSIGFVFQDPDAQFVVEVVEDELAFAMENAGLAQTVMRRRIEEALDQVEIAHLRHRVITTLSGGERQRVAIAAALTVQPRILLLDEPTSQLDPHTAEEVLTALYKLNADLGLTIVLSEHRLERVVQYVDRVLWVEHQTAGARQPAEIVDQDPAHSSPYRFAAPREILTLMPNPPPLAAVGKLLRWHPLPLTIKEGRRLAAQTWAAGGDRWETARGSFWGRGIQAPAPPRPTSNRPKPLLQTMRLHAAYAGDPALQGVDFTLNAGEIVAVMGRNGSGKTTLLRHLVGLIQPQQGRVLLDGQDIAGRQVEDLARQIGYVPQNPGDLLYHDTLADELRFTLRNHSRPVDEQQIGRTLEILGIGHLGAAYPRDLSGGEAQRAALAAILVAEPRIVLLDEPTRGLDYAAKQSLATLLKSQAAAGRGVVLVTHDVEFVALCASRVVLLGEGEVVVEGPTSEVLGDSLLFSTQVGKLFPRAGWLTVDDVVGGMATAGTATAGTATRRA
jgi:energy-coupling factor transport system ATP-binding protein